MDEVNDISSYINSTYTYLKYISPVDTIELDNYFTIIENDAEDIKILTLQYLRNETKLIDKTQTLIKNNFTQIYPNVKIKLNKDITTYLDNKIPQILKKLSKINQTYNESKYNNIELASKYENENYFFSKSNGTIKDINYLSTFSFDLENNSIIFNGTLNVSANIIFNTEFEYINETLKGPIVDGELGLNINYSLYDEKAYVKAYAKQKQFNYSSQIAFDERINSNFVNITVYNVVPDFNIVLEKKF